MNIDIVYLIRDGFAAGAVVPVAKEIVAHGAVFGLVVLDGAVFPDVVDRGLHILLFNDEVGHVADEAVLLTDNQRKMPDHWSALTPNQREAALKLENM